MGDLPYLSAEPERNILSITGGGFAGLFAAEFLRRLEADIDRPLSTVFDLYAGTSIGGLLALGLANGTSARSLAIRLRRLGPYIFQKKKVFRRAGFLLAKHDKSVLERGLRSLFATRTLGQISSSVVVPTVNMNSGETILLRSGPGPYGNMPLVDAALATSAAPFYLPVHVYDGVAYTDGGLAANSPEVIAIIEAIHRQGWDARRIKILVVGSTSAGLTIPGSMNRLQWGLLRWILNLRLLKLLGTAQSSLARQTASTIIDPIRMFAVDRLLSKEQQKIISLDNADGAAVASLCTLASDAYREFAGKYPSFISELRIPI